MTGRRSQGCEMGKGFAQSDCALDRMPFSVSVQSGDKVGGRQEGLAA